MAKADWPRDVGRHILAQVESTNAHALRHASSLGGPAWFMAHSQTAGRGRRARPWVSPVGNFHATLLTFPKGPALEVALRSFAIALALRDAMISLTGLSESYALKWPNDVLLNGRKVSGILLESVGAARDIAHLAIGVGVNLLAAPDAAHLEPEALGAVSLYAETGQKIAPEDFLDALAPAYAQREAVLIAEGFAPIRADWLANAARLGETITARVGSATYRGRFETIDLQGNLHLRTSDALQIIPAADIFF